MSGVGAELSRAREAQGLTHLDVAQQLRLAPRQIEALEQERFDALPGPTIARGMLRNYARLLELDADAMLERVAGRLEASDADRLAARFQQAVPFSDTARRSTLAYVGLSFLVLVVVAAMGYQWREERTGARSLAFVPAAKVPLEPPSAPAEPTPSAPSKAPAAAVPPPPAAERVVEAKRPPAPKAEPVAEAKSPPAPQAEEADAKREPEPEPTVVAAKPLESAPHRIVLRCEDESWVEVTDALDRVLVWALLPAGAHRVVEGEPPFRVVVGNARHVELSYDGRLVDLGPRTRGDVARLTLQ